jgi:predicted outer membrane protein
MVVKTHLSMKPFTLHQFIRIAALVTLATSPAFGQATGTAAAGSSASGTAKAPTTLSSSEKKFVKDAGEALLPILHLTEISRRPEQPGSEDLKKFIGKLGTELNSAWGELGTIAQAKGAELPKTDVTGSEKTTLDKLRKTDADKFDKAFLKVFTKETKKAAQTYETAEKNLRDVELKSFAQKWAPALAKANEEADKMEAEAGKKK